MIKSASAFLKPNKIIMHPRIAIRSGSTFAHPVLEFEINATPEILGTAVLESLDKSSDEIVEYNPAKMGYKFFLKAMKARSASEFHRVTKILEISLVENILCILPTKREKGYASFLHDQKIEVNLDNLSRKEIGELLLKGFSLCV